MIGHYMLLWWFHDNDALYENNLHLSIESLLVTGIGEISK
jgi:hypothetical protein